MGCEFERPITPQNQRTHLITQSDEKSRKGKLKNKIDDINPFSFGEKRNNAVYVKRGSLASSGVQKKQSTKNIFKKYMTPDKKLIQKMKDFKIKKKTKESAIQSSRNTKLAKAYGSATARKTQIKQRKINSKLESIINMCNKQTTVCNDKRKSNNNTCKFDIRKISKINSHFDKVLNTINDLDTKASSALENMFEFKKEEIQENEKDTQKIIKEYRKFRLSPDPKVMKMELKKENRRSGSRR